MAERSRHFDAVEMMREIRDKLTETFKNLTIEEQKRYIRERLRSKARRQKSRP